MVRTGHTDDTATGSPRGGHDGPRRQVFAGLAATVAPAHD